MTIVDYDLEKITNKRKAIAIKGMHSVKMKTATDNLIEEVKEVKCTILSDSHDYQQKKQI